MELEHLLERIKDLVDNYYAQKFEKFIPGKTKIPIAVPSYGKEEVNEAIDSLIGGWVTMGTKVKKFEELFAEYIGVKHAIMVNSGSSANLLALSILTNPILDLGIKPGDEVITPALTWPTTVYPIINNGLNPVFVDVDKETFDIDSTKIEHAITDKTKIIFPVHLLGNPANMDKIKEIATKHNLLVIEDCCEAHGAEWHSKKVGSFGDLSTFSFFISHHITTIEGGMILTNNDQFYEIGKALRAFGWTRDLQTKSSLQKEYPQIDSRFLFVNLGFNIRPTEIQGGFGIHQISKLEKFIAIRRKNAEYWNKYLENYSEYLETLVELPNTRHAFFCFPIIVKDNAPFSSSRLKKYLKSKNIEVRPVMAGNIVEQPVSKLFVHRVSGDLKNSSLIMNNVFLIPNHQAINEEQRKFIAQCIGDFIDNKKWNEKLQNNKHSSELLSD